MRIVLHYGLFTNDRGMLGTRVVADVIVLIELPYQVPNKST